MAQVHVTDRVMQLLGRGRVFKDNTAPINSLDFHRSEDFLITGGDDDSIHLYNTADGKCVETLFSRKYGVSNICMTHSSTCALYTTRKPPPATQEFRWYAIRYHDLVHNEYIRYFQGHTGPVTTLTVSPKNDTFMSAGQDKTMRLWDLRTTVCQGIMSVPGIPCASFDQQGLVFAVATESGVIKLYDVRSYEKGPFDTFSISEESNSPNTFSDLKFSNDGKYILGVVDNSVYVLDAFTGTVIRRFITGTSEGGPPMEAAFSACNQYVISGCEDRNVKVWSIHSGQQIATLSGHAGVPTRVKFAPKRLLVATACQALCLWIPPTSVIEQLTL